MYSNDEDHQQSSKPKKTVKKNIFSSDDDDQPKQNTKKMVKQEKISSDDEQHLQSKQKTPKKDDKKTPLINLPCEDITEIDSDDTGKQNKGKRKRRYKKRK